MSRCIMCDAVVLIARGDAEGALATAMFTAAVSLDGVKGTMCREHRGGYALALLRGGVALDLLQETTEEARS